jgi:predicted small lipoprotein YifL
MRTITRRLAILLLIALAGCTKHRPRTLPPPEEGAVSLRSARVTPRETGRMVVLRNVQVTADSVIGWSEGAPDRSGLLTGPGTRVAVHRSDVLVYEPAVPDYGAMLVNGILATGVVVLYLVSSADP